ncbi:hypothetical protein DFH09DRAFT_1223532 [Mycena vulgaris]|nr:hypothetical protein DFH09DRAFT_1223532 [Mycena vulgaris]
MLVWTQLLGLFIPPRIVVHARLLEGHAKIFPGLCSISWRLPPPMTFIPFASKRHPVLLRDLTQFIVPLHLHSPAFCFYCAHVNNTGDGDAKTSPVLWEPNHFAASRYKVHLKGLMVSVRLGRFPYLPRYSLQLLYLQ